MVRYRGVSLQELVSSDWLVQTRLAHVDVAVLGEGREQREEALSNHIVVIVHVTEPPEDTKHNTTSLQKAKPHFPPCTERLH